MPSTPSSRATADQPGGGGAKRHRAAIHLNHFQGAIYDRTGGKIGGHLGGQEVLLLTTRGRRTGQARRTPVQYQGHEDALYLVAAAGGAEHPPAWWHNIEADQRVEVQINEKHFHGIATTLTPEERAAVWPHLVHHNARLPAVQEKAGRELPVVRVELAGPITKAVPPS